jgi:hypothetical protein
VRDLAGAGFRADNGRVVARSRILVVVATALSASFVAAACSSAQYTYVRDSSTKSAFRIPTGWTTYDEATVLGEISGQPQGDQPDPIQWLVGVDGDPSASVSHVLNSSDLSTDYPQGIVVVQDLSFVERDNVSLNYLRNFLFPIDQLIQNESNAVVVSYNDEIDQNGMRGLQMVVSFRESALAEARQQAAAAAGQSAPSDPDTLQRALLGGAGTGVLSPDFVELDQKALVDDSSHKLYLVIMMCSSACYERNRDQIQGTVDSWTVSR